MAQTKIGLDGVYKPAPKWWRKLERSMLIAFIPAAVLILQSWGFKDPAFANKLMLITNVALVAVIKGVGMMLSNGDEYATPVFNTDEKKGDVG